MQTKKRSKTRKRSLQVAKWQKNTQNHYTKKEKNTNSFVYEKKKVFLPAIRIDYGMQKNALQINH